MSCHRYDWKEICTRIADLYNDKNMSVAEAHKALQEEGMDLPMLRTVQNQIRTKCRKFGIALEARHPWSEPTQEKPSTADLRRTIRQIRTLSDLVAVLRSDDWEDDRIVLNEIISDLYDRIDDALK